MPGAISAQAHKVTIESLADAQARVNAALDGFGSFEPGYGGAATGSLVSFVAKDDAGLLLDYAVSAREGAGAALGTTTMVFDSVKLGASALARGSAASPSALRFVNEEGLIEAFDVSGGVLKASATADTMARFDLADGIIAQRLANDVVMLSAPDFRGAIILVQGAAGQAGSFDAAMLAQGIVLADMPAGTTTLFKAFSGFEAELTQAEKEAQAQAIAAGELLGQVIVTTDPVTQMTTSAAVNYYADTTAITSRATQDAVEVLVDSATHSGKAIILSLDKHTVAGLVSGDAKLLVDGLAIEQAQSYADALVPDADKYWVITGEADAGFQAIVSLSHFSTRSIRLETPPGPSVFLWTTLALGAIVVGQAVYPRLKKL